MELGSDESGRKPGISGPTEEPRIDVRSILRKNHPRCQMSDWIEAKILLPPTTHVGYCPDNTGPTDIWDLALVIQKKKETVRQFWTRFLLKKNEIPGLYG